MAGLSEAQGGVLGFRFKKIVDETGAPALTYVGYSEPKTATSANEWMIVAITVAGAVTSTLFADGSALFNKKWDDRATYTYS